MAHRRGTFADGRLPLPRVTGHPPVTRAPPRVVPFDRLSHTEFSTVRRKGRWAKTPQKTRPGGAQTFRPGKSLPTYSRPLPGFSRPFPSVPLRGGRPHQNLMLAFCFPVSAGGKSVAGSGVFASRRSRGYRPIRKTGPTRGPPGRACSMPSTRRRGPWPRPRRYSASRRLKRGDSLATFWPRNPRK